MIKFSNDLTDEKKAHITLTDTLHQDGITSDCFFTYEHDFRDQPQSKRSSQKAWI